MFLQRTDDGADQLLLQLRAGTGYMDGHWAVAAAGHVETGESVLDAAGREATEELGIEIEPAELLPLSAKARCSRSSPTASYDTAVLRTAPRLVAVPLAS